MMTINSTIAETAIKKSTNCKVKGPILKPDLVT